MHHIPPPFPFSSPRTFPTIFLFFFSPFHFPEPGNTSHSFDRETIIKITFFLLGLFIFVGIVD